LLVKDLGNPKTPAMDRPVAPLYLGHTAQYEPLGVVKNVMYVLTDREAPKKKVVAVPLDRPAIENWKTVVPESANAIESAALIAGRVAGNTLEDVRTVARFSYLG